MIVAIRNTLIGSKVGNAFQSVANDEGSVGIPGVTEDDTSFIYLPQNATEWVATSVDVGFTCQPDNLWLCQELSGNLADSIGAVPLTVAGSPSYQVATPGWSTKAANITATVVQAFTAGLGVGPNPGTTSVLWMIYLVTPNTPGGNRNVLTGSNNAVGLRIDHQVSNKLAVACGVNSATTVGTYTSASVYPLILQYDRTNSLCRVYTNQELLSCTFSALVVDGSKGLGAVLSNGDAGSKYLYACAFSGVNAELTTAQIRTLLQHLGFAVSF